MCVCRVGPTSCWHDLDNSEYDCWPLEGPNDSNMIECGGEELNRRRCYSPERFTVLRPPGSWLLLWSRFGDGLGCPSSRNREERRGVQRHVLGNSPGFLLPVGHR